MKKIGDFMELNIDNLKKLKGSDDFEYIRKILIELKNMNYESSDYKEFIKSFQHYRLFMKPEYICDTYFSCEGTHIINNLIKEAINKLLYAFEDRYTSINEIDMENNCMVIAFFIKEICDEWGINSRVIDIWPGYDVNARLFGMSGFHYANIIYMCGKEYLVDLSYKQFFQKNKAFLEEIGLVGFCAPLAGIFMLMDMERKKVAEELLKNGFIELKGDNFKSYCDGFTISYRNGLYYKSCDNLYSTNYTNQDYINFLINKTDNQINHEYIRCLGPLKL